LGEGIKREGVGDSRIAAGLGAFAPALRFIGLAVLTSVFTIRGALLIGTLMKTEGRTVVGVGVVEVEGAGGAVELIDGGAAEYGGDEEEYQH
jgi:hypothetical protein